MGELERPETLQFAYINMPETFRLANQTSPGPNLLPALQARTNGRRMPWKIHDISLAI